MPTLYNNFLLSRVKIYPNPVSVPDQAHAHSICSVPEVVSLLRIIFVSCLVFPLSTHGLRIWPLQALMPLHVISWRCYEPFTTGLICWCVPAQLACLTPRSSLLVTGQLQPRTVQLSGVGNLQLQPTSTRAIRYLQLPSVYRLLVSSLVPVSRTLPCTFP